MSSILLSLLSFIMASKTDLNLKFHNKIFDYDMKLRLAYADAINSPNILRTKSKQGYFFFYYIIYIKYMNTLFNLYRK